MLVLSRIGKERGGSIYGKNTYKNISTEYISIYIHSVNVLSMNYGTRCFQIVFSYKYTHLIMTIEN